MPNWVYNHITITGNTKDLIAFAEKAKQQHETFWKSEDGTIEPRLSEETDLSFWNFIRPSEEDLPYYYGHKVKPEEEDDPNETSVERINKKLLFAGSDSYNWNVREWGTKWDACSAELSTDLSTLEDSSPNNSIQYRFETAWSIPVPVFQAMVKQHPELEFDFYSEEEQGWGAEFTSSDGEEQGEERSLIVTKEWDIPDSHSDYVERDNEDGCICSYEDDQDNWYSDCPRPKVIYARVTKLYKLKSSDLVDARAEYFQMETGTLPYPEEESDFGSLEYVDEDGNPVLE